MIWAALGAAAAVAAGASLVWWLRRRYLVVTVHGRSMLPTYSDGDRVLARHRRSAPPARIGDVVVADLPHRPGAADRVVKRVAAAPGDPVPPGVAAPGSRVPAGSYVLLGDNPAESADSRHYGYVAADRVVGVVLRHLR